MAVTAAQVKELREKTGVGMMECKKALTENGGDLEQAIVWLRERGLSRAAKKAGRVAAEGVVCINVADDMATGVLVEVNCETDFAAKNEDFQNFCKEVSDIALTNKAPSAEALAELKNAAGENIGDALKSLIAKVGENMTLRRVQYMEPANGIVVGYSHMGGKIGAMVALEGATKDNLELGKDVAMHIAAASPRYLKSDEVNQSELDQEKEIAKKKLIEQGKPEDLIEKILVGQMNKFYKEVCLVDQAFVKDPNVSITKLLKQNGDISISSFARFALGEGIEKKEDNFAEEVAAAVKGS